MKLLRLIFLIVLAFPSNVMMAQTCNNNGISTDPKYLFPSTSFPPGINVFFSHGSNQNDQKNKDMQVRAYPYDTYTTRNSTGQEYFGRIQQFQRFQGNDMNAPDGVVFSWYMMNSDEPTCTYDYTILPPGIVFGLRHTSNNQVMNVCNKTATNCSATSPIIDGLQEVCGGENGSPAGEGFKWFVTTGKNFDKGFSIAGIPADWAHIGDIIKQLPKSVILGLVNKDNHPHDEFLNKWAAQFLNATGELYNPWDIANHNIPPGFERVFLGDFSDNKTTDRGFWCFQSIAGKEPNPNSFVCVSNTSLDLNEVFPSHCSAPFAFDLHGFNLTEDITVSVPDGFEIAIVEAPNLSVPTGQPPQYILNKNDFKKNPPPITREIIVNGIGDIHKKIFVRFCAENINSISDGEISISTNGVDTKKVNVHCKVVNPETHHIEVVLKRAGNVNCYFVNNVTEKDKITTKDIPISWERVVQIENKSKQQIQLVNFCKARLSKNKFPILSLNNCDLTDFTMFKNNLIEACVYYGKYSSKCIDTFTDLKGKVYKGVVNIYASLLDGNKVADISEIKLWLWVYDAPSINYCW